MASKNYEVIYTWQMTGEGPSYRVRQRELLRRPDCRSEVMAGSMAKHRQTYNNQGQDPKWEDAQTPPEYLRTHWVYYPRTMGSAACPVEVCRGGSTSITNLHIQFIHRHVRGMIVILEKR